MSSLNRFEFVSFYLNFFSRIFTTRSRAARPQQRYLCFQPLVHTFLLQRNAENINAIYHPAHFSLESIEVQSSIPSTGVNQDSANDPPPIYSEKWGETTIGNQTITEKVNEEGLNEIIEEGEPPEYTSIQVKHS